MRIGAHVSSAGTLDKAIDRAQDIGAEAVQIFGSPPQSWIFRSHPLEAIDAFRQKAGDSGLADAVFMHGVYLINLATENPDNLKKGIDSLTRTLTLAGKIGAKGVIFHVGSHKGIGFDAVLPQVKDAFQEALDKSEGDAWLIIENNAGQGQQVGGNFHEIQRMIEAVDSPRVRVCLDTQHSFASGYNVGTEEGVAETMKEFEDEIGFEKLVAVHANDSKIPLAGSRDRHENIGDGFIGRDGFMSIMSHPAFWEVPFLLEVPGIENTGPDKENIGRLRAIWSEVQKKDM